MYKRKRETAIYLDFASTTPISGRVHQAIDPYFGESFGNPSSLHTLGRQATAAMDEARETTAGILGCSWKEVIFTPSATSAINLAIRGLIEGTIEGTKPHIITTNIEHSAVLNTCKDLEEAGKAEVTYLPAGKDGLITARQVKNALKENTVLVSVMYVNNEIGTIQPIPEIANVIRDFRSTKHEARNSKQIQNSKSKIKNKTISDFDIRVSDLKTGFPILHTDAVQAVNYLDINVEKLGVDMLTLSGHKIYGPKGAGMLYKKEPVQLKPVITGGGQQRGYWSGTENVPAIVGFAEALAETQEIKQKETERVKKLRDMFIDRVLSGTDKIELNGSQENRVVNNANFCFKNRASEVLLPAFDEEGVYVSGGSACSSRTLKPSHVIEAIGKKDLAKNAIRFTLGRTTTEHDIHRAAQVTINIANK